MIKYSR